MEKRYNLRNDPKPTLYNPHPTHRHTRDSEPLANDTPHTPHTDNTTTPHDSPVDSEGSQEDMMSTHDDDQTIDERAEEDDVPDQSAEDGERTTEEMPNGRRDDEQRRTEQEKETRPIDPVLLRIMAGIENLTQKQQEMSHNMDGLKENMDKNKEEVKQSMDKNKEEMKQSMDKKLDRNKHEIKEDIGELRQEMNSMMERHIKELKKEMKEEIKKSEHKMMQKVEDVHDRMTSMVGEVSEMKQQAYKTKEQVDRHEDKIEELRLHANSVTSNINDLKENMVEIKDQSDKQRLELEDQRRKTEEMSEKLKERLVEKEVGIERGLGELLSYYVPNHNTTNVPPKFNGRNMNPMDYINQLSQHYHKMSSRQGRILPVDYLEMVENTLVDTAASWFAIMRSNIHNQADFESKFLAQYWNREVQKMTRQRIENDTYREGRLSRTDHAIRHIITLRHLTPALQDDEIVQIIADQHSESVRNSIRMLNANNINALLEILNRSDAQDQHDKLRAMRNGDSTRRTWTTADSQGGGGANSNGRHRFQDNQHDGGGYRAKIQPTEHLRSADPPSGKQLNYQPTSRPLHQTSKQNPDVNKRNDLPYSRRPYSNDNRYDNRMQQTYRQADNHDERRNNRDTQRYPTHEQRRVCATMSREKDISEIPKEQGNEKQSRNNNEQSHFLGGTPLRQNQKDAQ